MSTGTSPEHGRPYCPSEQNPLSGDVASHLGGLSVGAGDTTASTTSSPSEDVSARERGSNEPPTYGAAAIDYYERTSGIRWEPLALTLKGIPWPKGDERSEAMPAGDRVTCSCDLLRYREAGEKAQRQTERKGEEVKPKRNEVDAFREALELVVDNQGRKVGEAAAAILGEQIANYMQRVGDRDPRPFVVLQDPATGALRIDYYSFEEVIPSTYNRLARIMNAPRASSPEEAIARAAAGSVSNAKKTGRGESGRGLPISEFSSTAWGIERTLPKAGKEHDGAHLVYIVTGEKLETLPQEPIETAKVSDADKFLAALADLPEDAEGEGDYDPEAAALQAIQELLGEPERPESQGAHELDEL